MPLLSKNKSYLIDHWNGQNEGVSNFKIMCMYHCCFSFAPSNRIMSSATWYHLVHTHFSGVRQEVCRDGQCGLVHF